MNKPLNYYSVLGVAHGATTEQVEEAARARSAEFPESLRDPAVNVVYRQLLTAYDVLRDPVRRAAYDEQLEEWSRDILEIGVEASARVLSAVDDEQLIYLLATIRAPQSAGKRRQPLNLCLVFDRSTSMKGERLRQVKAAAAKVIESLSGTDLISIVAFSDRAEVVVPSSHPNDRRLLLNKLGLIQAGGGTEIYRGLKAGIDQLDAPFSTRYVTHLLLLTDGHTYGDESQALQLARKSAEEGITFSAFGIGNDWNDSFLDLLASPSGGQTGYIENADEIVQHLKVQVEGLGVTYAQDVSLLAAFPKGVTCRYAIKLAPFAQPLPPRVGKMNLGMLEAGAPLSLLLELVVRPQRSGRQLEVPLDFRATIPSLQLVDHRFSRVHTIDFAPHDPAPTPPPRVVRAVHMLTLYRLNEKAWQEMEAGDLATATRHMQRLTSRLEEAGQPELAGMALAETERLLQIGTVSAEGRKKLKYGTRSLLTQALRLHDD